MASQLKPQIIKALVHNNSLQWWWWYIAITRGISYHYLCRYSSNTIPGLCQEFLSRPFPSGQYQWTFLWTLHSQPYMNSNEEYHWVIDYIELRRAAWLDPPSSMTRMVYLEIIATLHKNPTMTDTWSTSKYYIHPQQHHHRPSRQKGCKVYRYINLYLDLDREPGGLESNTLVAPLLAPLLAPLVAPLHSQY